MKRSGPIRRKSTAAAKRKRPQVCAWGRCKVLRAPVVVDETERYCKTHAKLIADQLVGDWVKRRDLWTCVKCNEGRVQWAHVISRGAPYIRWYVGPSTNNPGNSVALCARCHQAYTLAPAKWATFVEETWPGLWTRLVHREIEGERQGDSIDIGKIIRVYRARAEDVA